MDGKGTVRSEAYNRDCLEAMREMPDKAFDLAIVDPPYGLGEGTKHLSRQQPVRQRNGSDLPVLSLHTAKDWDTEQPPQVYFDELFRVSRKHIIFGENYLQFSQKHSSSGRIFWDKINGSNDFSDGEMAWTNLFTSIRQYRFLWNGMIQGTPVRPTYQQGNKQLNEKRIHPTQKPVALYKWLLTNYAKPGQTILDTHLGSGSSRIAAYDLGFDFTGYELDKDYFEAQEQRFARHIAQPKLFTPVPAEAQQEGLW